MTVSVTNGWQLAALIAILLAQTAAIFLQKQQVKKTDGLHDLLNSRLTALLEATDKSAYARAVSDTQQAAAETAAQVALATAVTAKQASDQTAQKSHTDVR